MSTQVFAFTTGFDIEEPEDFGELVAMLTADLARLVKAKKQIARRKKVAAVVRNRVAEQMGHVSGLRIFFRHYRNRVREEAARDFWAIRPAASLRA